MNRRGKSCPTPPNKILNEISAIGADIVEAARDEGLTTKHLAELIHSKTRELAKVFHQLSRPDSGNGDD